MYRLGFIKPALQTKLPTSSLTLITLSSLNIAQWNKVNETAERLRLHWVVLMKGYHWVSQEDSALASKTLTWEGTLQAENPRSEVDARIDGIDPESPATFIYTSGTTGPPRAVMLSHNNLGLPPQRPSTWLD